VGAVGWTGHWFNSSSNNGTDVGRFSAVCYLTALELKKTIPGRSSPHNIHFDRGWIKLQTLLHRSTLAALPLGVYHTLVVGMHER
jgi:hypothetical protein